MMIESRIVSEFELEGIKAKIVITHTPKYDSHPYEWHIYYGGNIYDDPTSWGTHFAALKFAIEKLEEILIY